MTDDQIQKLCDAALSDLEAAAEWMSPDDIGRAFEIAWSKHRGTVRILVTDLQTALKRLAEKDARVKELEDDLKAWKSGGENAVNAFESISHEKHKITTRMKKLEDALKWYADEKKYSEFYSDASASAFDRNFGSELGDDCGQRAREALKEQP